MDIKLLVGKRVRELRNNMGISQEELSDLTGLDRTYITSVKCGKRNIFIVNIEKLAKSIKCYSCGILYLLKFSLFMQLKNEK